MMKGFGEGMGEEPPDIPVPEIDVKKTKKTKIINGFKCKKVVLTMKLEITDPMTNEKTTAKVTLKSWLTEKVEG